MRALWLGPVLALTLTACSGQPRDELRGDVEAVTLAANDGSAQGVRDAVEELLSTIRAQIASGDLDAKEGDRLRTLALRIQKEAELLEDAAPSPAPTVEEEPEPTQEPEPEPTQEPEPEPTEQPQPTPEPTEEPAPEPSVEVVIPPVDESPPSAQSQSGSGSSPEPSAAA